jgi:pimeloyl-ACP methyl ester carboxylesterase
MAMAANMEIGMTVSRRWFLCAFLFLTLLAMFGCGRSSSNSGAGSNASQASIPYGDNATAGHYATVNGVKLYYEIYGEGEPLVLLHGNGGNIAAMKNQIAYFARNYKVIAIDCRGRGKSELGPLPLTYDNMAKDVSSLLEQLHAGPAYIVGRSDGGILSLLLAINYPERVKKVVAFGANLVPGPTALYPQILDQMRNDRQHTEEMMAKHDTSKNWELVYQLNRMMETQPNITIQDLHRIQAPVLVMSTDRDLIPEEHTLLIYRNIPKANLCILPGETHWITSTNPELFNTTVAKYISEPFRGEEARK